MEAKKTAQIPEVSLRTNADHGDSHAADAVPDVETVVGETRRENLYPIQISAEEDLIHALKKCGGNAQMTVFPDAGHEVRNQVYANPDLYPWLFSQTKK